MLLAAEWVGLQGQTLLLGWQSMPHSTTCCFCRQGRSGKRNKAAAPCAAARAGGRLTTGGRLGRQGSQHVTPGRGAQAAAGAASPREGKVRLQHPAGTSGCDGRKEGAGTSSGVRLLYLHPKDQAGVQLQASGHPAHLGCTSPRCLAACTLLSRNPAHAAHCLQGTPSARSWRSGSWPAGEERHSNGPHSGAGHPQQQAGSLPADSCAGQPG